MSAYVGSSKNLKDLKDLRATPALPLDELPDARSTLCEASVSEAMSPPLSPISEGSLTFEDCTMLTFGALLPAAGQSRTRSSHSSATDTFVTGRPSESYDNVFRTHSEYGFERGFSVIAKSMPFRNMIPKPCHFQQYDRSMFPLGLFSRDAP